MQSASSQLKTTGIVLLVLSAICIFVAIERYRANANAVQAMNQLGGGLFAGMAGRELRPGIPTATKYAAFFAIIFGGGGGYCLWKAQQANTNRSRQASSRVIRPDVTVQVPDAGGAEREP